METSLDVIRAQIKDAEPVLKVLDAKMEALEFDPRVPASVAAAAAEVENVVEHLMAPFKANPVLGHLAAELKTHYLENIQSMVAEAEG